MLSYASFGLVLGAAHASWPFSTPIGRSIVLNLYVLLPAAGVTVSLLYPRGWTAIVGTLAATVAWLWAYVHFSPPGPWDLMYHMFVLTVSWLAQSIVCVLAVLLIEDRRKVGRPPLRHRCVACGYSLIGLPEPRCPECGRPFAPPATPEPPHTDP